VYTLMREIELKPSRLLGLLGLLLAAMLLLALVAIYFAALPDSLRLALGGAVAGLAGWGWWRMPPMASLRLGADGKLQCQDDTAAWRDLEVLGDSFVSTVLIVLRYRIPGQPVRVLTLLPDSADADDLRRLRMSLRWIRRTRSDTVSPGAG
jgi:toxin CptA